MEPGRISYNTYLTLYDLEFSIFSFGTILYPYAPTQISPKLERYTELDEIGGSAMVNIIYKKAFEPIEEFEILKLSPTSYEAQRLISRWQR